MIASRNGKVDIPDYDFQKHQAEFGFVSSLTKIEVIKTLSKVKVECDKLLSNSLFLTSIAKIVKLDEFEQMQNQSLQNVKGQLKEGYVLTLNAMSSHIFTTICRWLPSLKMMIKNGFKDVGKGWFNMHESNLEVYKISKLKKFMTTVKFIMQDSLRFLVLNSLAEFIRMIGSISSQRVIVNGTNDVRPFDPNAIDKGVVSETLRRPLFQIDLVFKNGKVCYNTELPMYEMSLLALFDKSLTTVENLPQLVSMDLNVKFVSIC
jgi:dynein heavy chain